MTWMKTPRSDPWACTSASTCPEHLLRWRGLGGRRPAASGHAAGVSSGRPHIAAMVRNGSFSMGLHALGISAGISLAALSLAAPSEADAGAEPPVSSCLRVSGEARLGAVGYAHIVHLDSACPAEAKCSVATEVDPAPVEVKVPSRTSVEVVIRIGSPSREVRPVVTCTLVSAKAKTRRW